ncbi:hypothetical protein [Chryseobacterium sp.]|uniref:hypothetical protein n=1 Tax=Chryseobacterium sp. TaxID=1871047 RepID=UPI0011CC1B28|nr:hypothetical protein [Chryseobacterium sp.]TXF75936.1 hypothetical protein FUA25_08505 [Chryseobacterium sp.]
MKYFVYMLMCMALVSCTVYGFSNDYGKLSESEKLRISSLKDFKQTDTLHVYKINGLQLKEELKKHPKSLVYIFSNGCTSSYCLPMSNYETFARENGYKLYLVMSGYGKLQQTIGQRSEVFTTTLFAIDNEFYNSNYEVRYSRMFENDLRGIARKEKPKWEGNLFFFTNGELTKVSQELKN